MHRDKKIGFALGILLLGIVAAFFFRNEPDPFAELPPLDDPAALDAEIAEKPIAPYTQDLKPPAASGTAFPQPNQWDLPEIYRPADANVAGHELPAAPAAPTPINLSEPVPSLPDPARTLIEVGRPFGDSVPSTPAPAPKENKPLPGNEAWTSIPGTPSKPQPAAEPPHKTKPEGAKTPAAPAATPTAPVAMYKIQQGDTLSDLAAKHLGSSRRYMEIYEANRDKLKNPNDIKIGMMIRIPPRVKFSDGYSQPQPPKTDPSATMKKTSPASERKEEAPLFTPFSRLPFIPGRR